MATKLTREWGINNVFPKEKLETIKDEVLIC